MIYGLGTAAVQAAGSIFGGVISNHFARLREQLARQENYEYNEMAANSADERTRALYNDLYSPSAQIKQIKEAGLSPSMFYGDMAGVSGQAGAQGAGASGITPTTYGINPLDIAQISKLDAETENIKANTQKVNEETKGVSIENSVKNLARNKGGMEYELLSMNFETSDGKETSLFEIANNCNNYFDFVKEARKAMERGNADFGKSVTTTQYGMATLRDIYYDTKKLSKDIAVFKSNEISANFETSVKNALDDSDFAELNAKEAIEALRAKIAVEELTEQQKNAWNKILEDLGNPSSHKADWRDIIIVLAMIFNTSMSNWR